MYCMTDFLNEKEATVSGKILSRSFCKKNVKKWEQDRKSGRNREEDGGTMFYRCHLTKRAWVVGGGNEL